MRPIHNIIIHCTATPQTTTVSSIIDYWKTVKGWRNPGYHYIFNTNGTHVQLLPIEEVSNGVRGQNHDSINIAYIGGINEAGEAADTRTAEQKSNMAVLFKSLSKAFPKAEGLGHRDLSPDINGNGTIEADEWIKDCPCFDVKKWLKDEVF